jgi:uncharacterized protein (TIGR00303 family)
MFQIATEFNRGRDWVEAYRGKRPAFVCVLGFTETALRPGISAAGATPQQRQLTALADAELLLYGPCHTPRHALPALAQGASPAFISRTMVAQLGWPLWIMDAGLSVPPSLPVVNLGGMPAQCLSSGAALTRITVRKLYQAGLQWGNILGRSRQQDYLILSECVVGGTTTALGMLSGLGIDAMAKVNSSHRVCNHAQKEHLVNRGLRRFQLTPKRHPKLYPFDLLAAMGDPMQVVVAGMTIAASRYGGVLLAGGTQMLAVYALIQAIVTPEPVPWVPENVVVGTTRWVMEDPSGDALGLAKAIGQVPLLVSQLSFQTSRHHQLRAYEQGFVKEGVGAGGSAIAAHLSRGCQQSLMQGWIDETLDQYLAWQ